MQRFCCVKPRHHWHFDIHHADIRLMFFTSATASSPFFAFPTTSMSSSIFNNDQISEHHPLVFRYDNTYHINHSIICCMTAGTRIDNFVPSPTSNSKTSINKLKPLACQSNHSRATFPRPL